MTAHRGAAERGTLRVLTINVWSLPNWATFTRPVSRVREITRIALERQVDLLCVQELFDNRARRLCAETVNDRMPFVVHDDGPSGRWPSQGSGLMVASRFPVQHQRFVAFDDLVGSDVWANKGLLEVGIELSPALRLMLYNTHLQADPDAAPMWWIRDRWARARNARVSNLQQLAREVRSDCPWLAAAPDDVSVLRMLCGDFNVERGDGPAYQEMLEVLGDPIDVSDGVGRTFGASDAQLDYILLDRQAIDGPEEPGVLRCETVPMVHGRRTLSDHLAVEADIGVTPLCG